MSEETKKCRKCQTDIPKKASKCPNCTSKQPTEISGKGILWTLGLGLVFIISLVSISGSTSTVDTYTPPVRVSTFELGTYKVESEEFEYTSTKSVNLWQSYAVRTLVGKVSEGDVVEVIKHDPINDYCLVTMKEEKGWTACGWLVKVQ